MSTPEICECGGEGGREGEREGGRERVGREGGKGACYLIPPLTTTSTVGE